MRNELALCPPPHTHTAAQSSVLIGCAPRPQRSIVGRRGRSPSCPNVFALEAQGPEHTAALLKLKGEAESLVPSGRHLPLSSSALTNAYREAHGLKGRLRRLAAKEPRRRRASVAIDRGRR